jgi:hypothetical protein
MADRDAITLKCKQLALPAVSYLPSEQYVTAKTFFPHTRDFHGKKVQE